MTIRDVDDLHRRIDTLIRAAQSLRRHSADLHTLAWEPPVTSREKVGETKSDYTPQVLDEAPLARHLLTRINTAIEHTETELVGLDRAMIAIFFVHSHRPDPTRGSTISVKEFDRLRARQHQRRSDGEHVPATLEDQPAHPGKKP